MKDFDQLTITDDYMFCTVMEDTQLCKELLSMILKNQLGKIVKLSKQKPLKTQIASKGVRLDIIVEDEHGTLYDVEMLFSDRLPCLSENAEFCIRKTSLLHRTTAVRGGNEICFLKIGGADTRN